MLVLAVAGGWLLWQPINIKYLEPRATRLAAIASLRGDITDADRALADRPRVAKAIAGIARRTLGADLETVDHQLRSHLNRIGEEIGLRDLSVGTGRTGPIETPATTEFKKELREELDGVEVEGWITGKGTLEQALRTVHRLEAEPWLKRLGQVRLQAADNGASFQVTVRLATLYLPGREPSEAVEWTYDPEGFASYLALVSRNPFAMHAPSAAPAAPPPPPGFPYGEWMISGVAALAAGPEVWLRNTRSGETLRLAVGESLGDWVLASAGGATAEFVRGDRRLPVAVGETLAAAR